MEIIRHSHYSKKYNYEYLTINGLLHFDDKECFCKQPWIHLIAFKDIHDKWWKDYQIGIAIHDYDDYDIGYVYTAENEEQFFDVLHELINWVNDLEHGVISYWDYIGDIEGFFPDCGCKKERW